jgi:hypothetical protein
VIQLLQHLGFGAPLQGSTHEVGLCSQQPDIYHARQG